MLQRGSYFALTLVFLLPVASLVAAPAVDPLKIQRQLDSSSDWSVVKLDAKGGVDVYKKTIGDFDMPGFKGIKIVDVPADPLFEAINDFDRHAGLSEDIPLVESRVLKQEGNTRHVFAYLDVPGWTMANDRYWLVEAVAKFNIDGEPGHHKQTWRQLDPALYPEAVGLALKRSEKAVMVDLNHGSWEVIPRSDGKTELVYRVLSTPGGKIPSGAQALATSKTLPDNLLQFEAEGKRRAGK
ncbi:MAG: hypothetical protein VX498_09570 [Myxococcota bacterium]|nr:hypothetical protein [Myxococcota bacterium]